MLSLLYVTEGENRLRNENGWWLMGSWMILVNGLIWLEKPCGRNVGGDESGNCNGGRFFSILGLGVDLVRKGSGEEGDVWGLVKG